MSVQEPEPRIPNDDNGRGLRGMGKFLLIWVVIGLIWIPPKQWWAAPTFMSRVLIGCFVTGIIFLVAGHIVGRRTPSEEVLCEEAHDRIAASDDGADQHDAVA
jgi:hypothetical protein